MFLLRQRDAFLPPPRSWVAVPVLLRRELVSPSWPSSGPLVTLSRRLASYVTCQQAIGHASAPMAFPFQRKRSLCPASS